MQLSDCISHDKVSCYSSDTKPPLHILSKPYELLDWAVDFLYWGIPGDLRDNSSILSPHMSLRSDGQFIQNQPWTGQLFAQPISPAVQSPENMGGISLWLNRGQNSVYNFHFRLTEIR